MCIDYVSTRINENKISDLNSMAKPIEQAAIPLGTLLRLTQVSPQVLAVLAMATVRTVLEGVE